MQLAERERKLGPFVIAHAAGAQALRVQAANGGEHTRRQLGAPHVHGKHPHRQAGIDRDVLGYVQREGRFPHGGTAGYNDQIARLETGGLLVEVDEAGRYAGDIRGVVSIVQLLDPLDHLGQQRVDVHEAFIVPGAGLGDLEYLRFGLVEQGFGITTERIQRIGSNFVGRRHQLPQHRTLTHDLRVTLDVGRRRRVGRQFTEIGEATGLLPLAGCIKRLGDRHHVGRLGLFQQIADLPENAPVLVAIEIPVSHQIANAIPSLVIEQQTTKNRLLGFNGMRRNAQGIQGGVGNLRFGWALIHGEQSK